MPAVTYVGPFAEVDIPALGITVKNGEPFDVDAGAAQVLTAQADFEAAEAPKASKATPKEAN